MTLLKLTVLKVSSHKSLYVFYPCLLLAGGDSKTLMIVQVAPVEKHVSESTCSLSFGQRVRTVELGAASKKIETSDISEVGR
jgi:hypothetical protein